MNKFILLIFLSAVIFLQSAGAAPDLAPLPEAASTIRFQGNDNSVDSNVDEAIENSTKEVVTPHVEDVKVMTPNANEEVKKVVLKDTNESLKFTAKKFLGAMAGVAFSSVLIFLILVIMNKINKFQNTKGFGFPNEPNDDNPFRGDAPPTGGENEALRLFLDKTK